METEWQISSRIGVVRIEIAKLTINGECCNPTENGKTWPVSLIMTMSKQQMRIVTSVQRTGEMDRKSQKLNDCQPRRGSGTMGKQGTIQQKCAMTGKKQPPHNKIIYSCDRRGGKNGMSESRNGNEDRKIIDRKGSRQNNRWQRKAKLIGRQIKARRIINGQQ